MTNLTQFTIGSEVACGDEVCGKLQRVIVDPARLVLTHLVVEPGHGRDGHLVPVALVDTVMTQDLLFAGHIQLTCTLAEFETLDPAEETQLAGGGAVAWRYEQGQIAAHHDGLGLRGGLGIGPGGLGSAPVVAPGSGFVTSDRIPTGEVQFSGGEHVHAVDGTIGKVNGVAVDEVDHHVTHVLLEKGHLWGQKTVAIPISAVADVEEGIRVTLTKAEVRDLPAVDFAHSRC
ncbi:MAG TPA: PRC-barrel domain-containing protein [Actinocrinis sp.]|nr:PRC-barrel domain-containing protein [Actinocrinis sp.]